ncbi:hypothetical protein XBI1_1950029 [Xenorhabdus bovienii str. Intermedium]|uniref:Uncharacterized protein n=1 Tax=Xenorhabdus bovienii str. Intermedium TaxID=1379677 RepID=A0A077Q8A7_XENBV|nr:hypothetical protein XBI1_1950029 [Xenorhabdus bovienii str. Intermedium]
MYGGEDKDYRRNSDLSYLTNQGVECDQYDSSLKNNRSVNLHSAQELINIIHGGTNSVSYALPYPR